MNQKNFKGKRHTYAELSEAKRHSADPAQTSLNSWKTQHLPKSKTEGNPEDKRIKKNQVSICNTVEREFRRCAFFFYFGGFGFFFFVNELQVQYMQNPWLNTLPQTGLLPLGHACNQLTHSAKAWMFSSCSSAPCWLGSLRRFEWVRELIDMVHHPLALE